MFSLLLPSIAANKRRTLSDAVSVAVVVAELPATDGTLDVTYPGLGTPKFAKVYMTATTPSANIRDNLILSYGMTDGVNQGACMIRLSDGDSAGGNLGKGTVHMQSTSELFGLMEADDTNSYDNIYGTFNSWITDGIRLNVTKGVNPGDYRIVVEMWAGDSLSAKVGSFYSPTTGGTETVSVGFEANDITFMNTGIDSFTASQRSVAMIGLGMSSFDGTTIRQASYLFRVDRASNYVTRGEIDDDSIASFLSSRYLRVNNVTGTSFDIDSDGASSGVGVLYGALGFNGDAESWVGVLDSPTSTGIESFSTSGASVFTPMYFEQYLTETDALTTTMSDGEANGFAIVAGTEDNLVSIIGTAEEGVSTINTTTGVVEDEVLLYSHDQVLVSEGEFSSFGANQVNIDFTTVSGTTFKWPTRIVGLT